MVSVKPFRLSVKKSFNLYIMKYDWKKFRTFENIFRYALDLLREKKYEEAKEFYNDYIEYILEDAEDVNSIEEASKRASSNFGYFAGYFDDEVRRMVEKHLGAVHPIFGNYYNVTPEEAFDCGYNNKKLER